MGENSLLTPLVLCTCTRRIKGHAAHVLKLHVLMVVSVHSGGVR